MITIEDVRGKTAEERLNYFQEKLSQLIKLTDISQIPALGNSPAAIVAQIVLIDLQNADMLKKYGLRRIPDPVDGGPDKGSGSPPPQNPLAN